MSECQRHGMEPTITHEQGAEPRYRASWSKKRVLERRLKGAEQMRAPSTGCERDLEDD